MMCIPMMKKPPMQHSALGAFMLGAIIGLSAVGVFALCKTGKGKQMMQKAKKMGQTCMEKAESLSPCLQSTCQNGASTDTAETAPAFYSTREELPHIQSTCYEEDMSQGTPSRNANQDTKQKKDK